MGKFPFSVGKFLQRVDEFFQEENIVFLCFVRLCRKRGLYQKSEDNKKRFEKQYGEATRNNLNRVLADLKQDLRVESEKLRQKKTIQERKYINRIFKGELQRENKLISYERAFKMLENDMYIAGIGQAVLE